MFETKINHFLANVCFVLAFLDCAQDYACSQHIVEEYVIRYGNVSQLFVLTMFTKYIFSSIPEQNITLFVYYTKLRL